MVGDRQGNASWPRRRAKSPVDVMPKEDVALDDPIFKQRDWLSRQLERGLAEGLDDQRALAGNGTEAEYAENGLVSR